VAVNKKTYFDYTEKAANLGLPIAQYNLGVAYAQGQGTAVNHVEALKWFKAAAEQNEVSAIGAIGIYYQHGGLHALLGGLPKDLFKAFEHYE
jgi:TPR repeat protein